MKKILAFVLCLCILGSLALPALAAEEAADALLTVTELAPVAAVMEEEIPAVEETSDEEDAPVVEEVSVEEDTPAVETPVEADAPIVEAPVVEDGATTIEGTNVTWTLEDGVLTLGGSGAVPEYYGYTERIPFYSKLDSITAVVIGKDITSLPCDGFYYCENLTSITVEEGSSTFAVVDNVLFSADNKTLICYPPAKEGTSYTIPNGVTSIGQLAFFDSDITSVVIPDGVKSVGRAAFAACPNLTSLVLPDSVTNLGEDGNGSIVYGSTSLTSITLPSGLTAIGNYLLSDLPALKSVVIPEGVTSIGENAFSGCKSLESIVLPEGVTSIGASAFSNCTSLTSINVPEGVETLPYRSFGTCSSLASITLPLGLKTVDYAAFYDCTALEDVYYPGTQSDWLKITIEEANTNLTYANIHYSFTGTVIEDTNITWDYDEVSKTLVISGEGAIPNYEKPDDTPWREYYDECAIIVIEDGVTAIGTYAFADFVVEELTIPASVESIGQGAFLYCHKLATAEIPEGVKTLSGDAFGDCSGLTIVFLPSTLLDYGDSEFFAFVGCKAITDVYYNGSESQFTMYLGKNYFPETTEIHYSGSVSLPIGGSLTESVGWVLDEEYALTITGWGPMPDYGHSSETPWADFRMDINAIYLEDGITHAGDYAFDWCSNVTEVALPDTLESIGDHAFANGATGSSITFPASLKEIGPSAFQINKLTEVTLPEGIETVGASAFSGGELLEKVYVPASLTSIGAAAFEGCTVLTEVYFDGTAEAWAAVDGSANNANLPMVFADMGEKFAEGLYWSFEDGTLTISGIGPMPDYTAPTDAPWAQHLEKITAVVIGDGVTYVGDYTFDLCQNITDLTLPNSLTSIGSAAFRGCGLSFVHVPGKCDPAADAFDDNPIEILSLGEGHAVIPECFSDVTTLTELDLCYPFETLDGDFIAQNKDLEIVVVAPEPVEGIEFVEWIDEEGNVYFLNDILMTDVSGLTLYATYQYIWRDPGPFEDVSESDWFYEYVKYCYQNGIMKGTSETTFEPDAGATRAEVVTVLYRMAGEPEATAAASFGDIPAGDWYSDAVAWAASEGIAKGYEDGNFWPHSLVTREEFLVFLNRFADYMGLNMNTWSSYYHLKSFADYADVSDWAQEAEVWSVIMGLQTGVEVGDATYLFPQDSILRSELATFLCRFMDNIYSILEVEMLQSCVGMGTDYVIQLFGKSSSITDYGRATCPRCGEISEFSYWYYDGFAFAVHKLTDGTEYICYWGYTQ